MRGGFCLGVLARHYQHAVYLGHLHMNSEHAELKLKAWASRMLTPFLAVCLKEACAKRSSQGEQVPESMAVAAVALNRLADWMLKLEQAPRYLSDMQAQELWDLHLEFLQSYDWLAKRFASLNICRWPYRPKLHYFQELNRQCLRHKYNVRHSHCYVDEDCMGTVKGLCKRVHRRLLELRVLGRWLLRLRRLIEIG